MNGTTIRILCISVLLVLFAEREILASSNLVSDAAAAVATVPTAPTVPTKPTVPTAVTETPTGEPTPDSTPTITPTEPTPEPESAAQFGDRVWIESDSDGRVSTGVIIPVEGLLITATDGVNQYSTTTDANGYYSFTVPAGSYIVSYGPMPAAYGDVVPSAHPGGNEESGNAGIYREVLVDESHMQNTMVTLQAGEANWHVDFAFTVPLVTPTSSPIPSTTPVPTVSTTPEPVPTVPTVEPTVDGSETPEPTGSVTPEPTAEPAAILTIQKDSELPAVTLVGNKTITYTIAYSNVGNLAARDVTIIEHVPFYTLPNLAASSEGWFCQGIIPGSECRFELASLAPDESGAITFVVQLIEEQITSDVTHIFNDVNIVGLLGSEDTVAGNTATSEIVPIERPQSLDLVDEPFPHTTTIHLPLIATD